MNPVYSSEDVQQILQRAMADRQRQEFSYPQLAEMAAELDISSDLLQASEQEWLTNREELAKRQAAKAFRRKGFKAHLISYLAVNTFLVLLNLLTCPKNFWAIYPVTGWGLGLAAQGWKVYQDKP